MKNFLKLTINILILALIIGLSILGFSSHKNELKKDYIHNIEYSNRIERPIIENSFNWYDIKSNSAKFSISYYNNSSYKIIDAEDIVFLWNSDGSKNEDGISTFTKKESYWILDGKNKIEHLENIKSESNDFITMKFQINDLDSNTTYKDFGIYLKTSDSSWNTYDNDSEITIVDDHFYKILNTTFLKTAKKNDTYKLVIILFLILLILILLATFIYYLLSSFSFKKKSKLSLFYDSKASFEHGELVISLINVHKHRELWNSNEEDLKLFASGREMETKFVRTSEIPNGFRIFVIEDTSPKEIALSLLSASKYNTYSIGTRNTRELFHAESIADNSASKIIKKLSKAENSLYEETREALIHEISKKVNITNTKDLSSKMRKSTMTHISNSKSTSTTLRYQALFPKDHVLIKDFDLERDDKLLHFYHFYKGKLYKIEHEFVSKQGNMVEFNLVNLEPETIYVGLSYSVDGGEHVFPSQAIYGMTRDRNGSFVSRTDAHLGKPKNSKVQQGKLWTIEDSINKVGNTITNKIFDFIIKKHYEDENPENYLAPERAVDFYDDYITKWFDKK